MKKIINVRLPLLIAVVLAIGVAAGYTATYYNLNAFWLTAIFLIIAVSLIAIFIYKGNKKRLVLAIILLAVFFIGALNCALRLYFYNQSFIVNGGKYSIEGTIIARDEASNGAYVTIGFATANGQNLGGNVYAFIHESCVDGCEVGNNIKFYTEVEKKYAFDYGDFSTSIADNLQYSCSVYYVDKVTEGFYPLGSVNAAIRNILFSNVDHTTASIACGMLTGNTSYIDYQTLQNFRFGGIAHVFAVSGLHIGIVYGALSAFCKAIKSNKFVAATICLVGIFFYAGVCGFTPSSVRAAIMCTVLCVARLIYGKYDGLNSLSVAAFILLIINPLWLFTIGFQLSFGAVASIFLFSHTFKKWLSFLPKKICDALGISLSVQAGTLPVMLNSFGYLSVAGIFLNVIAIPVLSFIFVLILICVVLSAIVPPLAEVFINFSCAPLQLITSALSYFGLENAIIRSSGISFAGPLWYVIMFAISQRVNIKIPTRAIASSASATIIGVLCIIAAVSPLSSTNVTVTASEYGEGVIIKRGGQSVLVITETSENYFIQNTINKNCFIPPSAIVVVGGEESFSTTFEIANLSNAVYLPPESINLGVLGSTKVVYQRTFNIFGVQFEYLNGYDLLIDTENVSIAISGGKTTCITSCDLLVSVEKNTTTSRNYTVYFSQDNYKYNIYNYGDLHFVAKNDKINMQGILPNKESLY